MVTDCGFDTVMRDVDAPINETTAKELAKRSERVRKLRWATYTLILAWVLTAVALAGHMLHQCVSACCTSRTSVSSVCFEGLQCSQCEAITHRIFV